MGVPQRRPLLDDLESHRVRVTFVAVNEVASSDIVSLEQDCPRRYEGQIDIGATEEAALCE